MKFAPLAEKSGKGSISNLSTKVAGTTSEDNKALRRTESTGSLLRRLQKALSRSRDESIENTGSTSAPVEVAPVLPGAGHTADVQAVQQNTQAIEQPAVQPVSTSKLRIASPDRAIARTGRAKE